MRPLRVQRGFRGFFSKGIYRGSFKGIYEAFRVFERFLFFKGLRGVIGASF